MCPVQNCCQVPGSSVAGSHVLRYGPRTASGAAGGRIGSAEMCEFVNSYRNEFWITLYRRCEPNCADGGQYRVAVTRDAQPAGQGLRARRRAVVLVEGVVRLAPWPAQGAAGENAQTIPWIFTALIGQAQRIEFRPPRTEADEVGGPLALLIFFPAADNAGCTHSELRRAAPLAS
jgi:hypothetical protein